MNKQLKIAVTDRTLRLEKLLREKDHFMTIIIHDLQSPLAGLRNLIRLVRKTPEVLQTSNPADLFKEMNNATDQMFNLVQELLVTQKLNDTSYEWTLENQDLGSLLVEAVRKLRPNAVTKNITLNIQLPDEPIQCIIHSPSVEHILINLISNAVKYSTTDSSVHTRLIKTGLMARYEISDEGPGIPKQQQHQLFGKYQRLSTDPTAGEESSGLGLYLVGQLAEGLGGHVYYQPQDQGACFVFDLPIAPPHRLFTYE